MRGSPTLCGMAALGFVLSVAIPAPTEAALQWTWQYRGAGISASGTLTTDDVPNDHGYFRIMGITGSRNGIRIIGLQPAGTTIPGNEPYSVDNLISAAGPQLTGSGFGFLLADGASANPFFGHNQPPPAYLEFFSAPPRSGAADHQHTELPVSFIAKPAQGAGAAR
jgi:hypothetical protein